MKLNTDTNQYLDTEVYKPIKEVSKITGISRQWINTKANEGVIRTIKPWADVNLTFYNLDDAKRHFKLI